MEREGCDHNVIDQSPQLATPLDSTPGSPCLAGNQNPTLNRSSGSLNRTSSAESDGRVAIPRLVSTSEKPLGHARITRACALCQRKKTKCDGRRPRCGLCQRSGTVCTYTQSKREHQQLQLRTLKGRIHAYESLLQEIFSNSSEDGRRSIQDAIHASPEFFSTLLSSGSLLRGDHVPSAAPGLSLRRMQQAWQSDQRSQSLMLFQQPPVRVTSIHTWTPLVDDETASHLLSLYFAWENPTWQLIDQDLFVRDLEHGRRRFCSSLLVHTLLFFGCSFSYNFDRITDRRGEKTLGEALYAAIQRLWLQEKDTVDLPTAQSSILIGLLCCTFGIDKIGTKYILHGAELSARLGIHKADSPYFSRDVSDDDPTAISNCQKLVSWAIFDIQALVCQVYRKRPVWAGPPSIGLSQEEAAILDERASWRPYPFQTPVFRPFYYTASWIRSELVMIVDEIGRFSLRFPGSVLTGNDWDYGSSLYQRLLEWKAKRPWSVLPRHNTTPHVLCLHLYYQATIVSLCEIFLSNPGTSSDPSSHRHQFDTGPIKSQALDTIGTLILLFKNCHGWKSIPIVMLHYFCVAGIHAVSKLHPDEPKWSLVLESSVVGLWHMSLGWGRLCKAFLRTIELVLQARNLDASLIPPKVSAIFQQMRGLLWTDTDSASLSADYVVYYIPGNAGQAGTGAAGAAAGANSERKARALQDLLADMEKMSVAEGGT
ncbi:hypothetical protein BJX61DRAFT_551505 [Aspergillus egyptiacus]|nr:hypothetical protein BJX61DRAFT_551505 [Aspergillus egyptiacus]